MKHSVYFYLESVDTFQMSVQIQSALKILKMRIKISSLAIVITCHLYLLSCAGYHITLRAL